MAPSSDTPANRPRLREYEKISALSRTSVSASAWRPTGPAATAASAPRSAPRSVAPGNSTRQRPANASTRRGVFIGILSGDGTVVRRPGATDHTPPHRGRQGDLRAARSARFLDQPLSFRARVRYLAG